MITDEQMRAIALSMPEAEEKSHFGRPDFRVANKIFATLWAGEHRSVLKLGTSEQNALVMTCPTMFSVPPGGERGGWTAVDLALIDENDFRDLVIQAWRLTAPKQLAAKHTISLLSPSE